MRFSNQEHFNSEFDNLMSQVFRAEQILYSLGSVDATTSFFTENAHGDPDDVQVVQKSGVAVSFLIN